MSILPVLTLCCAVACGHSKLKGRAQSFFYGEGIMSRRRRRKRLGVMWRLLWAQAFRVICCSPRGLGLRMTENVTWWVLGGMVWKRNAGTRGGMVSVTETNCHLEEALWWSCRSAEVKGLVAAKMSPPSPSPRQSCATTRAPPRDGSWFPSLKTCHLESGKRARGNPKMPWTKARRNGRAISSLRRARWRDTFPCGLHQRHRGDRRNRGLYKPVATRSGRDGWSGWGNSEQIPADRRRGDDSSWNAFKDALDTRSMVSEEIFQWRKRATAQAGERTNTHAERKSPQSCPLLDKRRPSIQSSC